MLQSRAMVKHKKNRPRKNSKRQVIPIGNYVLLQAYLRSLPWSDTVSPSSHGIGSNMRISTSSIASSTGLENLTDELILLLPILTLINLSHLQHKHKITYPIIIIMQFTIENGLKVHKINNYLEIKLIVDQRLNHDRP